VSRLNIVVPYRDRAAHLSRFIPHVSAYFARDKVDRHLEYRVIIVEQEPGMLFNKGTLMNAGFLHGADWSDYTCFHDVDYLPIWADYSPTDGLTGLVWYGAEERPIAPGRSTEMVAHNLDTFFGGALLAPNDQFRAVDGYSNGYWVWGYDDVEAPNRWKAAGLPTRRRKGTYQPLDHDHLGFLPNGKTTAIAEVNQRRCEARWAPGAIREPDGLSTTQFKILNRRKVPLPANERNALWEIMTVKILATPDLPKL
jgi:hypothetical protein